MRGKTKEVVTEIDPALLDAEDQAAYLEAAFALRGEVIVIAGRATALRGLFMCNNARLDTVIPKVKRELLKLRESVDVALKKVC